MVVDSCIDQRTGRVPALDYLDAIGVDAATSVDLVIGTHAHQDHIAGLASVYERCASARFVIPQALRNDDYFALLQEESGPIASRGTYNEYSRIFDMVRHRPLTIPPYIKFAIADRYLLERSAGAPADVRVLAPSDEAVTRAIKAIAAVRVANDAGRPPPRSNANETSIALWIDAGSTRLLLGGDVERGPANCGWAAVVDGFTPISRAAYFKVPHHGSPNAHLDAVWNTLLEPNVISTLAPFRLGKNARPNATDRQRIKEASGEAYATAATKRPALSKQAKEEVLHFGNLARSVHDPYGACGQVRARHTAETNRWTVQTYGQAYKM
ncbi:hypothetical protein H7K62_05195 [Quadrisphaera sp. RL12-1S]|nr:hypothetical protein [Quadrisphaera sp. RL12-1S]